MDMLVQHKVSFIKYSRFSEETRRIINSLIQKEGASDGTLATHSSACCKSHRLPWSATSAHTAQYRRITDGSMCSPEKSIQHSNKSIANICFGGGKGCFVGERVEYGIAVLDSN